MVRRELLMHAIAYNLIRKIMLKSAQQKDIEFDQLSFTGTPDTVSHLQHKTAAQTSASGREPTREAMLHLCATDLLPQRPGRCEPSVLKRRPKPPARAKTWSSHPPATTAGGPRNQRTGPRKMPLS